MIILSFSSNRVPNSSTNQDMSPRETAWTSDEQMYKYIFVFVMIVAPTLKQATHKV